MIIASRSAAITAFLISSALIVAGCAGGGNALPTSQPVAHTSGQWASAVKNTAPVTNSPSGPTNCTVQPVKSIQASVTKVAINLAESSTATFEVCTQYFSKYTPTVADPTIASVTITPLARVNGQPNFATVTVTGLKAGSTSVSISDKKGQSVKVCISVTPAPITFSPPSPLNLGPVGTQTITVSEADYTGSFAIKSCTSPGNGLCQGPGVDGVPGRYFCFTAGGSSNGFVVTPVAGTPTTQFTAVLEFSGQPLPTNCTFTFSDQQGQTAIYTITGQ